MERVREVVRGLKDTDIFINAEQPFRRGRTGVRERNMADKRKLWLLVCPMLAKKIGLKVPLPKMLWILLNFNLMNQLNIGPVYVRILYVCFFSNLFHVYEMRLETVPCKLA